jgi:hypothetical protein
LEIYEMKILRISYLGIVFLAISFFGMTAKAGLILATLNNAVTQNFDGLGTSTNISGLDAGGWRLGAGASPTFATGTSAVSVQAAAFTSISSGGQYNLRNNTTTTDRALGFLNSSGFTSPRSIMLEFTNNTGSTVTELDLAWNYEKYRSGTREFNWSFFHGGDGSTWTAAAAGNQNYLGDANNSTAFSPPTSISKTLTLTGLNIANNSNYYLRWDLSGVGGSTNGQAIGIDNFSITAVPEPSSLALTVAVGCVAGVVRCRRSRQTEEKPCLP